MCTRDFGPGHFGLKVEWDVDRRFLSRQWLLGSGIAGMLTLGALATLGGHMNLARADAPATVSCDVDNSKVPWNAEEIQLLKLTNDYRVAHGLGTLQADYVLTQIALWKGNEVFDVLRAGGAPSHDDTFRSWQQRFQDCAYLVIFPNACKGENLDGGRESAAATFQAFKDSPPHNRNLLEPSFTTVGIKRVQQPDPANAKKTFWVWMMDFGSELDQDVLAPAGGQISAGPKGSATPCILANSDGSGSTDGSAGTGDQGQGSGDGTGS